MVVAHKTVAESSESVSRLSYYCAVGVESRLSVRVREAICQLVLGYFVLVPRQSPSFDCIYALDSVRVYPLAHCFRAITINIVPS